jgi:hypothetical protein
MKIELFASSPRARRSSQTAFVRTSFVTKAPSQTSAMTLSLSTTSPARAAR